VKGVDTTLSFSKSGICALITQAGPRTNRLFGRKKYR